MLVSVKTLKNKSSLIFIGFKMFKYFQDAKADGPACFVTKQTNQIRKLWSFKLRNAIWTAKMADFA